MFLSIVGPGWTPFPAVGLEPSGVRLHESKWPPDQTDHFWSFLPLPLEAYGALVAHL